MYFLISLPGRVIEIDKVLNHLFSYFTILWYLITDNMRIPYKEKNYVWHLNTYIEEPCSLHFSTYKARMRGETKDVVEHDTTQSILWSRSRCRSCLLLIEPCNFSWILSVQMIMYLLRIQICVHISFFLLTRHYMGGVWEEATKNMTQYARGP